MHNAHALNQPFIYNSPYLTMLATERSLFHLLTATVILIVPISGKIFFLIHYGYNILCMPAKYLVSHH